MNNGLSRTLEPQTLDEATALARAAVASKLYSVASPEAALMILLTGRDLGLTASQSFRAVYIVSGKPVVSSDAMVAAIRRSGLCASWRVIETTTERCTIETLRAGESEPERETFTQDDAARAGLSRKDVWRQYPRDMLRHRAAAGLARRVYPDVVLGCYAPGELEEQTSSSPTTVEVRLTAEQIVADYDEEVAGGADPDLAFERAKSRGREHRVATKVQSILNDRERVAAAAKRAMLEAAAGVATVALEPVDYDLALQTLLDELTQIDSPAGVAQVWRDNRASLKDAPPELRQRAWSETARAWDAYGGQGGVGGLSKAVVSEGAIPVLMPRVS
jgi:hypothetical protein